MATTQTLICSLCDARSPSIALWMSHLRNVHQSETEISVSCPMHECSAVYSKVNSLCSHVYRKHKALLSIPVGSSTTASPSGRVDNPFEANVSDFVDDIFFPDSLSHDIHQLLHRDAYELKKKSILFLMQLKEEQLLTQTAVNVVVSGYKNMFEYTLGQLKAGVSRKLSVAGIDSKDIDGLDIVFDDVTDPFMGLETSYLQDKFISQELGCIVS